MEGRSQQQPLFRWKSGGGDQDLEWIQRPKALVPAIRDLLQAQLRQAWGLSIASDAISVEFMSQGTWNRAYKVTSSAAGSWSSDFPSPLLASDKVRSEVATLRWVRRHTAIPVPRVFLYDATGRTFSGYEWILMELMPGKPFWAVHKQLPLEAKTALAATIAEWVHSLWSLRFDGIGSLYDATGDNEAHGLARPDSSGPTSVGVMDLFGVDMVGDSKEREPHLGPISSEMYMIDWRPEYPVPRGPFSDLRQFCSSFADVTRHEINDPRQQKRAKIYSLIYTAYYEDYEYALKRPDTSLRRIRVAKSQRKLEDKKARRERRDRVAQAKVELAEIFEGFSTTSQLDSSCPEMYIESLYVKDKQFCDRQDEEEAKEEAKKKAKEEGKEDTNDPETEDAASDDSQTEEPVLFDLATRPCDRSSSSAQVHGLVSLDGTPYLRDWNRYPETMDQITRLIQNVVPDTPLPPRCSVLHHWDISGNNVLVDPDTGHPTALLDWEQIFTVPVLPFIPAAEATPPADSKAGFESETAPTVGPVSYLPYPPIMEFDESWMDLHWCSRRPSYSWIPKQSSSCDEEDTSMYRYKSTWEIQLMREAYKTRLDALSSPPSIRMDSLREAIETVAESPKGNNSQSKRPGLDQPSPHLTDKGHLLRDIMSGTQQTVINPWFVEEVVKEAMDLGLLAE
ncbi:hypothetical protein PG991_001500 [Apiospora marii]|uniref:Aminoglycoside phosphotransferase domain-containing protein n=1 Tax=Apiospora marii TaxID=335849 RepID=A0ABR1SS70_9PEZI